MRFVQNDGGRAAAGFKGTAGDCVARAVAIASGRSYGEVYAALADGMGSQRNTKHGRARRSARSGVNTSRKWFKEYMRSLGAEWTPTMRIGSGCTVHLKDGELPMGRLVVSVSNHYTAVIDGVLHDTYDPREGRETIYSPDFPKEQLPRGARWLANGNGWLYAPDRCVYGYWTFGGSTP